jgi:hypothetical protein
MPECRSEAPALWQSSRRILTNTVPIERSGLLHSLSTALSMGDVPA